MSAPRRFPLPAFARTPDAREMVRLALPAIGNSLLQTSVFLVDRLMLGHHSEEALAAMQSAGPIAWTVFSVFGAFAVGTTALVGRAIGSGDRALATSAVRGSLALAVVLGIVVGALGEGSLAALIDLLGGGGNPVVRHVAISYLRVMYAALPAFFVGLTGISALQAAGNTRTPFLIGIATNVLNIAGNAVLVFGNFGAPRLGAIGSACSSVAAGTLEAVLAMAVLLRADSPVSIRRAPGVDAWSGAVRVVRVSLGSWGEKVVYHAGYLAFVSFVIALGERAMAANQALISVESISFLTADGCAIASGALVAQRLGAKEPARARTMGWLGAGLCASLLAISALVFALFPAPLVLAFRSDPRIVAAGVPALRVAAVAQLPMAIAVVLAQSIRGAGATREALAVSFAGALVVRLAATYVFVRVMHFGLAGVWMGSTADWLARAAVYAWRWNRGSWSRATV